ncbi:3'-5' exonuclease [Streptomyces chryseus]|uniref:3'-5' exonuclease n=1 Tax=Streptomyces chryseus TaxID=68186 RepID=UPI00142EED48|nr:3'-5' exonuclease [Streptomyces chryseus]
MTITDPAQWEDLFTREVDEHPVQFVRPADTDRPFWAVYEGSRYLGTLGAEPGGDAPVWRVQATHERHGDVSDAVRALRRPVSWARERAQVCDWAGQLLADPSLVVLDVESTGLVEPWAVQIAVTDRGGNVVFDEYVNPLADIEPGAIAVHGITPERVQDAPTFGALLPALTDALHGRTVVAYQVEFDRGCFERELTRHHGSPVPAEQWLAGCRWRDAMVPYAVFKGLWSAKRGAYRNQRLGGPHDAVGDCRMLLKRLEQMAAASPSLGVRSL